MLESSLTRYFEGRQQEMLSRLCELVGNESGYNDKAGVDRVGARMTHELKRLGFKVGILPQTNMSLPKVSRPSTALAQSLLILAAAENE